MNLMKDVGSEEIKAYQRYTAADGRLCRIFADFPICFKNGDITLSTEGGTFEDLQYMLAKMKRNKKQGQN